MLDKPVRLTIVLDCQSSFVESDIKKTNSETVTLSSLCALFLRAYKFNFDNVDNVDGPTKILPIIVTKILTAILTAILPIIMTKISTKILKTI